MTSCDSVSREQPVEVFAQEFAASSINFEVTWWCGSTPLDVRKSRDEVVAAVKAALDDAGIEIPFPYRTLTFKEPLTLAKNGRGELESVRSDASAPAPSSHSRRQGESVIAPQA